MLSSNSRLLQVTFVQMRKTWYRIIHGPACARYPMNREFPATLFVHDAAKIAKFVIEQIHYRGNE
jgi:hypothetical protein